MMITESHPLVWRVLTTGVLAAVAAIATACSSGTPAPSTTVTITQSPGSSSPAGSPSPSSPQAGPAECQTSGLRVSVARTEGAAGTIYYTIDFTNVSAAACILQGYPGVSLVSAGSDAGSQIGADAKRNPRTASVPITLAPGQVAHAVLGIAEAGNFSASSCSPVTAHWLKVFPPDQRSAAYLRFTTQTCASTSVPTMHITPISAGG